MQTQASDTFGSPEVLTRLGTLCGEKELESLAGRLHSLSELVSPDMTALEDALRVVPCPDNTIGRGAQHLLELSGKRLRPLCLALAARVGSEFGPAALDLAVAVELVHTATLLHDDVVDLAPTRRGMTTSRQEYGNAASIFAGDWLLVEALRRVQRAAVSGVMDHLLRTMDQMICAESLQLEQRGRLDMGRGRYFQVAEGKTAALFRWAMVSGGRAGGLSEEQCDTLEEFGLHLGVAFQIVDDLLDLVGDSGETGKGLFSDLREGKMTLPLILALERDPLLAPLLQQILGRPENGQTLASRSAQVVERLHRTDAIEDCRQVARRRVAQGIEALDRAPQTVATEALCAVAASVVDRRR
jgi:octaprenyl-diphosphate synthase